MTVRFWENGNLAGLDRDQWEAICDGCGKCCLVKLEDEETGEVFYTDLRCRHLDEGNCRCTVYETRRQTVPACIELAPDRLEELWLMPPSCAYRRIAEGRGLPAWHHLVCGDRNLVRIVSMEGVDEWPELSKAEVAERLAALVAKRLTQ